MRIVLLIVLVVVAVWVIRRALRTLTSRDDAPAVQPPGDLVSCARCGLHLPRTEAREAAGRLFCSDDHARLGVGPQGR